MNAFVAVAEPPIVVTEMFLAPAVLAGVIAVICVSEFTTKLFALAPPIITLRVPVKYIPLMVMDVPPAIGPVYGFTDVIVGAAT